MKPYVILRTSELEKLRLAWTEPQTRYIHVWGVAGAGKTTIVRQILSEADTPIIEFQCRLATQLDLRSLMARLEAALLAPDHIEILHKKKQKALIDAGYQHASRTHSISLDGNSKILALGDVVAGDKIHKSDAQYDRELLEECRLQLEIMGSLLGPCAGPMCTIFLDSLEAVDESTNHLNP